MCLLQKSFMKNHAIMFVLGFSVGFVFSGCKNPPEPLSNLILIPGGDVMIGSEQGLPRETPVIQKEIKSFYLEKHPVTVAQFAEFVAATHYVTEAEHFGNAGVFDFISGTWSLKEGATWKYPQGPDFAKAQNDHPVTQVSWNDAQAYCKWANRRLPTEFEWELAAKNGDSGHQGIYPWGNEIKDTHGNYLANYWQGVFPLNNSNEDGYITTSPVGAFGETPIGLQDMAGNVWEWCSNTYEAYAKDSIAVSGPLQKVQRGGSFLCDTKVCHGFRVTARSSSTPDTSLMNVGFRCAKDVD